MPDPPRSGAGDEAWARWARDLVRAINILQSRALQPASSGWAMTNVTETRVLDANSTSTDEIADVLGTLIDDLKTDGKLEK